MRRGANSPRKLSGEKPRPREKSAEAPWRAGGPGVAHGHSRLAARQPSLLRPVRPYGHIHGPWPHREGCSGGQRCAQRLRCFEDGGTHKPVEIRKQRKKETDQNWSTTSIVAVSPALRVLSQKHRAAERRLEQMRGGGSCCWGGTGEGDRRGGLMGSNSFWTTVRYSRMWLEHGLPLVKSL